MQHETIAKLALPFFYWIFEISSYFLQKIIGVILYFAKTKHLMVYLSGFLP
jgi:hypothetical protein